MLREESPEIVTISRRKATKQGVENAVLGHCRMRIESGKSDESSSLCLAIVLCVVEISERDRPV
jgi:hypothetical protein